MRAGSTAGVSLSGPLGCDNEEPESDSPQADDQFTSDNDSDECASPPPKCPMLDNDSQTLPTNAAQVIGSSSLNASSRYNLLTNHFKPSADYNLPKGASGRSVQYQWLQSFPWLVYSKQEDGSFCLPCVLFAPTGYRGSTPGVLVSPPLKVFKKALDTFRKHADKEHHKTAIVRADEFNRSMSNQQPNIQQRLSKSLSERIANNRLKLESIIKTIVLCGRQNIALRGHRDSALDNERDVAGWKNHGDFTALLNFRIDAGDTALDKHLTTAVRNSTYTSNTVQNQIITMLVKWVTSHIISKVKAAKWFTVIADEVADVSNQEQLSIVLRYADNTTLIVREDLAGFFECETGVSGRDLASKIKSALEGFSLDLSFLRGQAYDGAGNMGFPHSQVETVRSTVEIDSRRYSELISDAVMLTEPAILPAPSPLCFSLSQLGCGEIA